MSHPVGSIPYKVIAHLRMLPEDSEISTAELSEAIGHPEITCLDFYLSPAIEEKTIEVRNAGGLKFWSLSTAAWWAHSSNSAQPAPVPTVKRKPLTRVRVDPLANAIAGRAAWPDVINLKAPAPPAAEKPKSRTKAKPASKAAAKQPAKRKAAPAIAAAKPAAALAATADCPPRPRKSVAIKNMQQRDDFPELGFGTEACPHNVVRHSTRYADFFATVQIDGPPIKCQTQDLERVRIALRMHLKRTQKAGTYQIRSIRNFSADNTSRLWVQSVKETSK